MKLEFDRKSTRELLQTPVFRLREDIATHPVTEREGRYYVLDCPDWVNIVALTEAREIILVKQWRHGTRSVELEIPAGIVEPGEDPARTAARELEEETGFAPARCTVLGGVHPNCAIQSNRCVSVLAEGCVRKGPTRFDAGEQIELELLPLTDLPRLVRDGTLRNGMMLVALLFWLDAEGTIAWPAGPKLPAS
jgi:ADP-ribose pyrophosphatase